MKLVLTESLRIDKPKGNNMIAKQKAFLINSDMNMEIRIENYAHHKNKIMTNGKRLPAPLVLQKNKAP